MGGSGFRERGCGGEEGVIADRQSGEKGQGIVNLEIRSRSREDLARRDEGGGGEQDSCYENQALNNLTRLGLRNCPAVTVPSGSTLTVLIDYKPDLGRGSTRVMRAKHNGLV